MWDWFRVLSFSALVLTSGLNIAAQSVRASEVTDGGFEQPASQPPAPAGWTLDSHAVPPATLDIVADQPHSGSRCARLTNASAGAAVSLRQAYHLEQFCLYTLSAWVRSSRPGMAVQVDLRELKGPQIPVAIRTFAVGTDWQQVAVRGIAPDTTDGAISFKMSAVGSLFIDDVDLTKTGGDTVDVPAVNTRPIDPFYFGMHYHEGPIHTVYLPELSPKYLRLWDDHLSWSVLEPKKGQWDFTRLDAIVQHAPPEVRIILVLGQTPTWASSRPEEKGNYGMGSAYMPKDIQDWNDYVQTVGTRYKGRIKYWEIWNECNWKAFWRDGVDNMVTLTHAAHDVLKAIDPTNQLCSPGFTKDLGEEFINQWFYEGAGKDVDVISYHFYPTPSVDAAFTMARDLMELKKSYGCEDLPLLDTEYGEKRKFRQVPILAEMNLLYWFSGIESQVYYTFDDKAFGLTAPTTADHFDSTKLNPAGVAYAQTRKWMLGAVATTWTIQPDGVHYVQFERSGGYHAVAIWKTPDRGAPANPLLPHEGMVPEQAMVAEEAVQPVAFKIPAAWQITTARDLTGAQRPVSGMVRLTDEPVLLESERAP